MLAKRKKNKELRYQSKLHTNLNQVGFVRVLVDKDEFSSTTRATEKILKIMISKNTNVAREENISNGNILENMDRLERKQGT